MGTDPHSETFTFQIVSPKYGQFTVTAPARFRESIEQHVWYVSRNKQRAAGRQFAVRTNMPKDDGGQRTVLLHIFVWALAGKVLERGKGLDHLDGQPLNNSEDNLRPASSGDNSRNRQKQRNNTSGFIGVTFHKRIGKFHAQIQVTAEGERRGISLGYCDTKEEAGALRDAAALRYHGAFAVTNDTVGVSR